MSAVYEDVKADLRAHPKTWLVTGAAGFIGSNVLEALLVLGQKVVGFDNFATGFQKNLDQVCAGLSPDQVANFTFINGDLRNFEDCTKVVQDVDIVLHLGALGSVPRSIKDPLTTNAANINGFLNMLTAARDAQVGRFVYAASSSTYGDHQALPKREDIIGKPLSPYAVTKYVNELYAQVFARTYGFKTIGLRFFNVFGRRQTPDGAYAAAIPKWTSAAIHNTPIEIYGDGKTSRDFCYIDNAIQACILACTTTRDDALDQVYNVAVGDQTTLNEVVAYIREALMPRFPQLKDLKPIYKDFRKGDVRHSLADISKARTLLGYNPEYRIRDGILHAMDWYVDNLTKADNKAA